MDISGFIATSSIYIHLYKDVTVRAWSSVLWGPLPGHVVPRGVGGRRGGGEEEGQTGRGSPGSEDQGRCGGPPESGHRGNIPQRNKAHIRQTYN